MPVTILALVIRQSFVRTKPTTTLPCISFFFAVSGYAMFFPMNPERVSEPPGNNGYSSTLNQTVSPFITLKGFGGGGGGGGGASSGIVWPLTTMLSVFPWF